MGRAVKESAGGSESQKAIGMRCRKTYAQPGPILEFYTLPTKLPQIGQTQGCRDENLVEFHRNECFPSRAN